MGKRSDFKRVERDFYPTPESAVLPLLPHLSPTTLFAEPCCGEMHLVNHIIKAGHVCTYAGDISMGQDALEFEAIDCDAIITNPPWDRAILHPMIEHFSAMRPTWLLFDADWMHTKQSARFMPWCRRIISVGRVKWFPDSPHTEKDNCAWYLFDQNASGQTEFFGR